MIKTELRCSKLKTLLIKCKNYNMKVELQRLDNYNYSKNISTAFHYTNSTWKMSKNKLYL